MYTNEQRWFQPNKAFLSKVFMVFNFLLDRLCACIYILAICHATIHTDAA
jgi:hypothetical protein